MDYARVKWMNAWLRHPVLGDPSFDTFERLGPCVHRSEPPYEWAVNGSLFRDPKGGDWYYYAGLYAEGYQLVGDYPSHCAIYRSADEGKSWSYLGPVFEKGFVYEGHSVASDCCPDAVVTYDAEKDIYWMSYDWGTNNTDWANAFEPVGTGADSGAALAWASSPAGPFMRLPQPHISNVALDGLKGRFKRMYASTLLKRKQDWIALTLCDSSEYFSWGLAAMTAPSPEGPWSQPTIVLSIDRPEYYPAPVEFYPCFVVEDTVYAPATSVAASRNYQAMFSASLEDADRPEAWQLLFDGNAWHSRVDEEEKYGIWGQTFHGFAHNGVLNVMYPSKNAQNRGTLFVASRPWDEPFRDSFTLSGHVGPSIAPLLAAYGDFVLKAEFTLVGTVDFAFDYDGILGSDSNRSDSVPHLQSLSAYSALRIRDDGRFMLVTVDSPGKETVHVEGALDGGPISSFVLRRHGDAVIVELGGSYVAEAPIAVAGQARPLALIAHQWSNLHCTRFEITDGIAERYALAYNGWDALLGAGQRMKDWETSTDADVLFRTGQALISQDAACKAKWNVIGDGFELYAPKSPEYGVIDVYIDGELSGYVDLHAETNVPSAVVHAVSGLVHGRHSIALVAVDGGKFPLDSVVVHGEAPK